MATGAAAGIKPPFERVEVFSFEMQSVIATFNTMDAAALENKALRLTNAERALLAGRLLESLKPNSPEIRAEWVKESESRLEAFKKDKIESFDGVGIMAEFKKQYKP